MRTLLAIAVCLAYGQLVMRGILTRSGIAQGIDVVFLLAGSTMCIIQDFNEMMRK